MSACRGTCLALFLGWRSSQGRLSRARSLKQSLIWLAAGIRSLPTSSNDCSDGFVAIGILKVHSWLTAAARWALFATVDVGASGVRGRPKRTPRSLGRVQGRRVVGQVFNDRHCERIQSVNIGRSCDDSARRCDCQAGWDFRNDRRWKSKNLGGRPKICPALVSGSFCVPKRGALVHCFFLGFNGLLALGAFASAGRCAGSSG